MTAPAAEVYEIVVAQTSAQRSIWRSALALLSKLPGMGAGEEEPGALIISVIEQSTGREQFRHVEEAGDDEDHLLAVIQNDLATRPATAFATRWLS